MTTFAKVEYAKLNARQKEVYNFHHIAALLARYGYATYLIRDDWSGGDMFARHMLTNEPLTVQIKSRLTFAKKYLTRGLWIAFPDGEAAYLFPHDELLNTYIKIREARGLPLIDNRAWSEKGEVHWDPPTAELLGLLKPFRLEP